MAARNVVRFLKSLHVSYSCFDTRSTGASEFYRQMTAEKTRKINPKAEIAQITTLTGSVPTIKLDFINGSKHVMEVPDMDVRDIFEELDFHCSQIETEYEKQGKSIE